MEGTILRSEALKIIDNGAPFNLDFVTADARRGTGGDYISVAGWMKQKGQPAEEIRPGEKRYIKKDLERDPKNHVHKTFLIYNPANSHHPVKVHFRLIQYLNGKRIING